MSDVTIPEDIPVDVWEAAERPAFRVRLDMQAGQLWDIQPTIARAILAEREHVLAEVAKYVDQITLADIAQAIRSSHE